MTLRARRIILREGQTMHQRREEERLILDAGYIVAIVRERPGLRSKSAIAEKTGLSLARVERVIKAMNSGEVEQRRIEYGTRKGVTGWYVIDGRTAAILDQADLHSDTVERGVRRSRLVRLRDAYGLPVKVIESIVQSIEQRLGQTTDVMTASDLEAFDQLLAEALEEETR